jgi:hypothetical protein
MNEAKIVIAIPSHGVCSIHFAFSLCALMSYMSIKGFPSSPQWRVEIAMDLVQSSIIPGNRETLVKRALDGGHTHVLFLDDDMTFKPEILDLMFARQQPIVVTNYLIKVPLEQSKFVAVDLDGLRVPTREEDTGLTQIAFSGFGASLFDLKIFRRIARPWFMPDYHHEEHRYTTEDEPFFRRARQAGFPVLLDHDASKLLKHGGYHQWDYKMWQGAA